VSDASTGSALPLASAMLLPSEQEAGAGKITLDYLKVCAQSAWTDGAGCFRTPGLDLREPYTLYVFRRGYELLRVEGIEASTPALSLVLEPLAPLRPAPVGTVQDRDGALAARARVGCRSSFGDLRYVETDEQGGFELDDVVPGETYFLVAWWTDATGEKHRANARYTPAAHAPRSHPELALQER
jgi:hypothetical protein